MVVVRVRTNLPRKGRIMQGVYRYKKDLKLYRVYKVTPRCYATTLYEREDIKTLSVSRINKSSLKDYVLVYTL